MLLCILMDTTNNLWPCLPASLFPRHYLRCTGYLTGSCISYYSKWSTDSDDFNESSSLSYGIFSRALSSPGATAIRVIIISLTYVNILLRSPTNVLTLIGAVRYDDLSI